MKGLKGALMFAQSGGPTSVINASAAGVFIEGLSNDMITEVYGAAHGIRGILNEEFYDMSKEDIKELELLKNTPSSALGSAYPCGAAGPWVLPSHSFPFSAG